MHTMTRQEVARELRITPQALTNRIARGQAHPPYVQLSPRRRLWIREEFHRWLQGQQKSGAEQTGPFKQIGLKPPRRT